MRVGICLAVAVLLLNLSHAGAQEARVAETPLDPPADFAPRREPVPTSPMAPARDRGDASVADSGTNGDVFMTSPAPYPAAGVLLQAKPSWPFIVGKTGSADATSAFIFANSADAELMRIGGDGKVGIGTATPQYQLDVVGSLRVRASTVTAKMGAIMLSGTNSSGTEYQWAHFVGSSPGTYGVATDAYEIYEYPRGGSPACCIPRLRILPAATAAPHLFTIGSGGNIGIGAGAMAPADMLHLAAAANTNIRLTHTDPASAANFIGFYENNVLFGFMNQRGSTHASEPAQVSIGNAANAPMALATNSLVRMRILANGDVGIGTSNPTAKLHVEGNIIATGSITGASVIGATYQDLAEWVPATVDMQPGTVVILNPESTNEVMPSSGEYDVRVAGVVSAQPGIILGVAGDAKEQIATTGRVRVMVDATSSPIRVGDLLVTSAKAGRAMRSEPMDISGRKFHQPGTIIGKALEPLAGGEGQILVLLSMQ